MVHSNTVASKERSRNAKTTFDVDQGIYPSQMDAAAFFTAVSEWVRRPAHKNTRIPNTTALDAIYGAATDPMRTLRIQMPFQWDA
jgi:hypothetical protein